jgi:hypothetical protein
MVYNNLFTKYKIKQFKNNEKLPIVKLLNLNSLGFRIKYNIEAIKIKIKANKKSPEINKKYRHASLFNGPKKLSKNPAIILNKYILFVKIY